MPAALWCAVRFLAGDRRMDTWFGEDAVFDHEIEKEFLDDIEAALAEELEAETAEITDEEAEIDANATSLSSSN